MNTTNMNEMNTGPMPSVTTVADAKAGQQKTVMVDYQQTNLQSASRARGGRMDLEGGKVNPNDMI